MQRLKRDNNINIKGSFFFFFCMFSKGRFGQGELSRAKEEVDDQFFSFLLLIMSMTFGDFYSLQDELIFYSRVIMKFHIQLDFHTVFRFNASCTLFTYSIVGFNTCNCLINTCDDLFTLLNLEGDFFFFLFRTRIEWLKSTLRNRVDQRVRQEYIYSSHVLILKFRLNESNLIKILIGIQGVR